MIAMILLVIIVSILALIFSAYLTRQILKEDTGTEGMRDIANLIKIGAEAFVKRQYTTIGILTVLLALIIYGAYSFFGKDELGWRTSVSFLFGAASSAFAGIFGMWISVRANIRTASSAKKSMRRAFLTAFRGGAVT